MAWIIGIDEAGYGPNLGPLVMSAVAFQVPDDLPGIDLWKALSAVVCRPGEEPRDRLRVGDSKQIYSAQRGLRDLELGILTTLSGDLPETFDGFLTASGIDHPACLKDELWYQPTQQLPHIVDAALVGPTRLRFRETGEQVGIRCVFQRVCVIGSARFNALVDRWDSKGAVLGNALIDLIRVVCSQATPGERLEFLVDKHGGRNTYVALLQEAFPDDLVSVERESMACSSYRTRAGNRQIRLTFQPRADDSCFCVALASMLSKYLRELLMGQFNAYWRSHLPDLRPTAGYPADAARFYAAIRPLLPGLGLTEDAIWRKR